MAKKKRIWYFLGIGAVLICTGLYFQHFGLPSFVAPKVHLKKIRITGPLHPPLLPLHDPWNRFHFPMTISDALTHRGLGLALTPDRRFLVALSDLETFPGQSSVKMPQAVFAQGAWSINSGHAKLGSLPPYPDFTDAMRLLRANAKRRFGSQAGTCNTQQTAGNAGASSFDYYTLIQELTGLDRQYKSRKSPDADIWIAAKALSRLAFLDDSDLSINDPIASRAMALVAIAEVKCGKSMPKEESLLAAHLGYRGAAAKLLTHLPKNDPWRMYFTKQDFALQRFAVTHPDDGEAGYLWLLRLSYLDRKTDWVAWYKNRYAGKALSPPVLLSILQFSGFGSIEFFIHRLPRALFSAMPGIANPAAYGDDIESAPAKLIHDYDNAEKHLELKPDGPYLTIGDLRSYYRGYLVVGLYTEGRYQLKVQDNEDASKAYRDALKSAPGDIGKALYRWINVELKFKHGGMSLYKLTQAMADSKVLTPDVYNDVFEKEAARVNLGSPQNLGALKRLGKLYDTRYEDRVDYAHSLMLNMQLGMYVKAQESLVRQESPYTPYFRVWEDYFIGDKAGLLQIASDSRIDRRTRSYAVHLAKSAGVCNREIRLAYESLIKSYKDNVGLCEEFLGHLSGLDEFVALGREARFCLANAPADYSGLATQDYVVYIAESQLHLGEKDKAWDTISKLLYGSGNQSGVGPRRRKIADYYANVLGEATYIALGRGDDSLAESLAQALANRYPDSVGAQAVLLRVWWTEKHYEKAADFLVDWKQPLMYWTWENKIGSVFAEIFKHDPTGAQAAFKALQQPRNRKHGVGNGPLTFIVAALADNGAPGLASKLRHYLALPVTPNAFPGELGEYQLLKQAEGSAAAIRWITKNSTPPGPKDPVRRAWLSYTSDLPGLLWSPVTDPKVSSNPEMVWLYRAAAYVRGMSTTRDEVARLNAHFKQTNGNWQDLLGRYLMGQVSTQTIMSHPFPASQLFEAIYFVAIRQLADGNYTRGRQLLELETDSTKSGQWRMQATGLLSYWRSSQSLPVLKRRGKLFQSGT